MSSSSPSLRAVRGSASKSGEFPLVQSPQALSFREVFDAHVNFVWRLLRSMGVPANQVEDAAQEVFVVVHDKLSSFEGRSRLSTWIGAIAYRVGANHRRKHRRHAEAAPLGDDDLQASGSPEQSLSDQQAARFVDRFCSGLDEGMRDVFVLCLLEQTPATEVAELLGIPVNTVYSRVRLLRESFRRALVQHHAISEASCAS